MWVVEYGTMALGNDGHEMQAPKAPPIAVQSVTFTTSTATTNALNDETTLVMLLTTAAANVKFAGTPTATATTEPIPGEVPMYFGVPRKSGLKVAAVTR